MIHRAIHADYDGRSKQACLIAAPMHIQAHGIEGTACVDPVRWSDYAFIPERKHLAANNKVRPAFGGIAELNIGLADIPGVLVRQCCWNVLVEKNMGVLSLAEESEPFRRLNRHVKPDPAQQIFIIGGCVPYAVLAFDASPVFASELHPAR